MRRLEDRALGVCVEFQGSAIDGFNCPIPALPACRLIPSPVGLCALENSEIWIDLAEGDFPDFPCTFIESDDHRRCIAIIEEEQICAVINNGARLAIVSHVVELVVSGQSPENFPPPSGKPEGNDPRGAGFGARDTLPSGRPDFMVKGRSWWNIRIRERTGAGP